MKQFIRENKKNADCAIVGTYNATVWLYGRANYKKIEKLAKKKYRYSPRVGLDNSIVKEFWKDMGIRTVDFQGVGIQDAEKEILNGKAAFASIRQINSEESHLVFLAPNNRAIEIINSSYSWIGLVEDFLKGKVKLSIWTVEA